jgi:ATP-dependent DNA helicase RecQ
MAIKAARDRGWESYRSIERFMSASQRCRRRQILDHFGDSSAGAPLGRCCDVCCPDSALVGLLQAAPLQQARSAQQAQSSPRAGGRVEGRVVDRREFERLREWRLDRAQGLPAYTVASNAVLEEVLCRQPGNLEELLALRGVGPAFCSKHGVSLLDELGRLGAPAQTASGTVANSSAALASEAAPT